MPDAALCQIDKPANGRSLGSARSRHSWPCVCRCITVASGALRPRPAAYETAIQSSLAILEAFAATVGTKQAVLSSQGGRFTSISFQPRPYGVNWTAEHALTLGETEMIFHKARGMHIEVADMLHLAAKVTLAITRCQAGRMVDAVTTFTFDQYAGTVSGAGARDQRTRMPR